MALQNEERIARIRLIRSENVGAITFRRLVERYGSASRALSLLPDLACKGGKTSHPFIPGEKEILAEEEALKRHSGRFVVIGESEYPPLLHNIDDAPPVLSVVGHPSLLSGNAVSIVGSRNASPNGMKLARHFAAAIGDAGYRIVSGMARGIDTAAHEGALNTGTVAVLGGGVDHIYPRENARLYNELKSRGAIVSDQPLGTVAQARHFPRRNRIISGFSRMTLVIEADLKSGSLITARLANEQGREVAAIPGSPLDPRARGTNDLIRNGAQLVETPDEVIALLNAMPSLSLSEPTGISTDFSDTGADLYVDDDEVARARTVLLDVLGPSPTNVDDIIRETGLRAAIVHLILIELELAGRLERHSGGRISLLTELSGLS